jgi:hypothetical protein
MALLERVADQRSRFLLRLVPPWRDCRIRHMHGQSNSSPSQETDLTSRST